jgi:hypothetical protein
MQIVDEAELSNSVDTLSRWMAHRIAELINNANKARRNAERETLKEKATNLILRLWERRSSWPQGWPPKTVALVLERLENNKHVFGGYKERTGSPWLDSLWKLDMIQSREHALWLDAALADFDVEQERKTLEKHGLDLKEEEKNTLEQFLDRHERASAAILNMLDDDKDAAASPLIRAQAVATYLQDISKERLKLLEEILQDIAGKD